MMQQVQHETMGLRARVAELAAHPNTKLVAVGVAAVVLTPILLPLAKPVLKTTIKSGLKLFEQAKGAIAETGELLADIAAEAKAEVTTEAQKQATPPVMPSAPLSPLIEG